MEPDEWLKRLRQRPDFQERALALRSDPEGLDAYLDEFFNLAALPEAMRAPVLARLRQAVLGHDPSGGAVLYQVCAEELQAEYQRCLSEGMAPAEWGHLLLYPPDFEETAVSLRSDEAALHRYLAEVFREAMLVGIPPTSQDAATERLRAAVLAHDLAERGGLLPKCVQALYAEMPAEMTEQRQVRLHLATETKPLVDTPGPL